MFITGSLSVTTAATLPQREGHRTLDQVASAPWLCSLAVLSREMAPSGLESLLMVSPALLAPPFFLLADFGEPISHASVCLGEPFPDVF